MGATRRSPEHHDISLNRVSAAFRRRLRAHTPAHLTEQPTGFIVIAPSPRPSPTNQVITMGHAGRRSSTRSHTYAHHSTSGNYTTHIHFPSLSTVSGRAIVACIAVFVVLMLIIAIFLACRRRRR